MTASRAGLKVHLMSTSPISSSDAASVARPWASFCLATYRRPERLATTLRTILAQTFADFEVIVTDNDPERSAQAVVEALGDRRISYHSNQRNLGMVGNFNRALHFAVGSFVVMITDDDPIYPNMLMVLNELWRKQPQFGAYYGACEIDFQDDAVAAMYGRPSGRTQFLASRPADAVWSIDADQFPTEYFQKRVFPYVLWSCGVVRREIALEVDGMPDYGSPYLTDFGYITLVGGRAGFCCVNTVVGFQAIHSGNFGRRETGEVVSAIRGFHSHLERRMSPRPSWPRERAAMEAMLAQWFIEHMLFLWAYHPGLEKRREILMVLAQCIPVPYLRRMIRHFLARIVRQELQKLRS